MAGVYGVAIVDGEAAAAQLAVFVEGASTHDVAAYLSELGGLGAGLVQLLQNELSIGKMFCAIYNLGMLAEMALANQQNCRRLSTLGQGVLACMDNAGRRGAHVRTVGVEAMSACFEDICRLIDAFTQPGWLLRLVCNVHLREEFQKLHQAVSQLAKGEGLLSLTGARPLVNVEYKDVGRPLRRLLKQIGSGSLLAGVKQLHLNDRSRVEVARLLDVHYRVVTEEVASLPCSDLGLSSLYHQMLGQTGQTSVGDTTTGRLSDAASSRCNSRSGSRANSRRGSVADAGASSELQAAAAGLGRSNSSFSLSMTGQAAVSLYGDLFRWYDRNRSGLLEKDELQAALMDLGVLEGKSAAELRELTNSYMQIADAAAFAKGKGIGFEAFCKFYETMVMAKARQQLRFKLGLQVEEDLRATFLAFAGFGSREHVNEMDGAHFLKLCKESSLLDARTGQPEVDLVFCSVKTKGARKIKFEQFLTALATLADRKAVAFEEVVMAVMSTGGPVANSSVQPEFVRLHDDKSTFTGVYARGGPSTVDQAGLELSIIVNRCIPESAKRGAGSPSSPGSGMHPTRRAAGRSLSSTAATPSPSHSSQKMSRANSAGSTTPFSVLAIGHTPRRSPCRPCGTQVDQGRLVPPARAPASRGPLEKALPGGEVPLTSAFAAAGSGRDISASEASDFPMLLHCEPGNSRTPVKLMATSQLAEAVASAAAHTPADNSSRHTPEVALSVSGMSGMGDGLRGNGCGMHPPSSGSSSRWFSSARLGFSPKAAADAPGTGQAAPRRCSRDATPAGATSCRRTSFTANIGETTPTTPPCTGDVDANELRDVFTTFAGFGIRQSSAPSLKVSSGGMWSNGNEQQLQADNSPSPASNTPTLEMDGFRFVKLCRDTGLFDGRFTTTQADIIFAKVKDKGAKKINYSQFLTALSHIASAKKMQPSSILNAVLQCGGPVVNSSVTPDLVWVHDSR